MSEISSNPRQVAESSESEIVVQRVAWLTREIEEGRLKARANLEGITGEGREILDLINQALEAATRGFYEACHQVDGLARSIAARNSRPRMPGSLHGSGAANGNSGWPLPDPRAWDSLSADS